MQLTPSFCDSTFNADLFEQHCSHVFIRALFILARDEFHRSVFSPKKISPFLSLYIINILILSTFQLFSQLKIDLVIREKKTDCVQHELFVFCLFHCARRFRYCWLWSTKLKETKDPFTHLSIIPLC